MREKSVLLTTLGSTGDDRLDYQYFYYDNHGHLSYCNSLSVAEAGTKYILSQKNIDEIIVLGSGATYNPEDALRPQVLRNFEDYSAEGKVLDKVSNAFKDVNMSRFEYGLGLGGGLEIWRLQLSLKYFWNFGSLSSDGHKVDSPIGRTVTEAFKEKKNFNGLTLSAALFF